MYNAYVTKIKNVRKHGNADKLNVGECFGNTIVVGLNTLDEELGIYFPTDGKLGLEYATENNLLRIKDENGNNIGGYLDYDKRNISTLKLRGEKSDGLFMPLLSLEKFCNIKTLKDGDIITVLNGIIICEKYIPLAKKNIQSQQNKTKNGKKIVDKSNKINFPLFKEHIDTSQYAYNKHVFKEGDLCYITLKMHGTSQRMSYTIKEESKYINPIKYKLMRLLRIKNKTKKDWEYITGTRRVVLKDYEKGYYGSNQFRKPYHDCFVGKLRKGENIYFEIVGYTHNGGLIMGECDNTKTKDKEFIKQYGKTTKFTYGCEEGKSDMFVYRMTMTNEDGNVVEYSTEYTQLRCEQMGIKFVPVFDKFFFTTLEDLEWRVNKYTDGIDPIGKTHIREGVVVKIENKEKFTAYKNKSFNFKVLESIIKVDAVEADMEEIQELTEENRNDR